jgi:hypothetical protein
MGNDQDERDPDRLMSELHEIADQFEEDGWETIRIKPGAVTALSGKKRDRFGLDVIVSRDTFDEIFEMHEASEPDSSSYELFKRQSAGRLYFIVGIKYPDAETIVFYPSITSLEQSEEMFETVRERGEMRTRLRPLSKENIIVISHDDPELFYPETA